MSYIRERGIQSVALTCRSRDIGPSLGPPMKTKGPVDLSRAVVVNVDVQNAFGEEAASDKLQGLEPSEKKEVDKAAQLSEATHAAGGAVVVTKDWHTAPGTELPDGTIDNRAQDEFAIYGEHALGKTKDAELNTRLERTVQKLEQREGTARTVVPVDQYDDTGKAGSQRIIEVHKNVYDVTKRLDVDGQTKAHGGFIQTIANLRARGIDTAIITGKIAEVCVRAAALSIAELFPDLRVIVAEDAVSSLPPEVAKSLGLETKEEVMAMLASKGIEVRSMASLLPKKEFIAAGLEGR
jgi:nicotinamidase-related amidase